ncbi:unnamed protein product [Ixodes persulcatus]
MGRAECTGWQAFEGLLQAEGPSLASLYRGMLLDHLQVPDALTVAVSAALGKRLFTHLVPNVAAATELLRRFNGRKLPSSIGFQALDRALRDHAAVEPTERTVERLLDRVGCDSEELRPALGHWLGKWLLCSSLELAVEVSRKYKLNCVTLEGDTVLASGVLSGGHRDPVKNAFVLYSQFSSAKERLSSALEAREQVALAVHHILLPRRAASSEEVLAKIQNLQQKVLRDGDGISKLTSDCKSLLAQISHFSSTLKTLEKALAEQNGSMQHYRRERDELAQELSTALAKPLTRRGQEELQESSREEQELRKLLRKASSRKLELQQEISSLESTLQCQVTLGQDNVTKEKQLLEEKLLALRNRLDLSESRLTVLKESKRTTMNEIEEIQKDVTDDDHERKLEQNIERLSTDQAYLLADMEAGSQEIQQLDAQRQAVLEALNASKKKVSTFGSVSAKLEEYRGMERQMLHRLLSVAQGELKAMGPPNLAAIGLFEEMLSRRKSLQAQVKDTDQGRHRLGDLTSLEQNKYGESIEVTLKQVSLYFSDIFRKFVPRGSAVMIFTKDDEPGDSPPTPGGSGEGAPIAYRALHLNARFCSRGPLQDLRSLSGGQRSVVALSFILALQKADPAPFYLFDEVDSHLDRDQREALAQVLEELSDSSQFICTTFSPELVQKGNVFYVTHKQGASHVESVSPERALNLLQGIITCRPED